MALPWNWRYSRDYDRARRSVDRNVFVNKVYPNRTGAPNFMSGTTIYGRPMGRLSYRRKMY